VVGISPRAFAEACRIGQVKSALRRGERVTPALHYARIRVEQPPLRACRPGARHDAGDARKGAPGVEIDFTIADSPLGRLLLAVTARGVCRVMIGDADPVLERDLRDEYPRPWCAATIDC
jgi:AraC family transcriptional regulator of adaptative response/methylated-DNA-[protein]-cysteine methyltransferase